MVFITGDTHNNNDLKKVNDFAQSDYAKQNLTKNDYLIVSGDFGVLWDSEPNEHEEKMIKFYNSLPFTTLFIDGNHENFERLKKLPTEQKFGSEVGKISHSIFHLRRGHIYNIENNTFFTFGGGASIDKARRFSYVSWWPDEMPNFMEYSFGLQNLYKVGYSVDYIITHTAPGRIAKLIGYPDIDNMEENLRVYFDRIELRTHFKKWFFGHFHKDQKNIKDKFNLIFNKVERII